jgi:hypothetical protein
MVNCVVGQDRLIEFPIASHWRLLYTENTPKGRREDAVAFGNGFLSSFQFWMTCAICTANSAVKERRLHLDDVKPPSLLGTLAYFKVDAFRPIPLDCNVSIEFVCTWNKQF